ncbi:extracellular solute-binding protein [Angustibacter sp. McL0619]|uniref:ABC transporter substrate-binding protein n=1 Tax=Angustibacter sp. McL0619 TaxID=3415676 RepID=UPI003CEAB4B5
MHLRRPATAVAAATICVALGVTGCGSSSSDDDAASGSGGKTTLTVSLFGTFGYQEAGLFDKYHAAHPNITIKYDSTEQEKNYWTALQTKLASGSGASDVQAIEVGRITDVAQNQGDKWLDLKGTTAAAQIANYPAWKEAAATTKDGAVLGLGTDIGPTGICYRTDLMKAAGMPTDPAELASKLTSWDDYIAMGEQFKAKAPKGTSWTDAAGGLYNVVVSTESKIYYDESGQLIWNTNPAVKHAFDLSAKAGQDGLTAKLGQFTPEWNSGFSKGSFATIACPSWMVGYIKGQAGDGGSGKWNVTTLPGGVGGNWGGAYLSIPKQSKHQKEAADLIKWLTDPEQQATVFNKVGNFPSNKGAFTMVADTKDDYFSGAPIGKVFGDIAAAAPTQIHGKDDGTIQNQISTALQSVETNHVSPDKAWATLNDTLKTQLG